MEELYKYRDGWEAAACIHCADEGVEQQLTIIPKLGSLARRKSLVNHAFPELHRKVRQHAQL